VKHTHKENEEKDMEKIIKSSGRAGNAHTHIAPYFAVADGIQSTSKKELNFAPTRAREWWKYG